MSFKVTPITERKVKYKTITWNQKTDGNIVFPSTLKYKNALSPAIASPDNVLVSAMLEILEPVTAVSGTPLCSLQGDTAYGSFLTFLLTSYAEGIHNLTPSNNLRRFGGELAIQMFVGEFNAGHFALTIGYLEKQ